MSKNRGEKDKVKRVVAKRESILGGSEPAFAIVTLAEYVSHLETKIWIFRSDVSGTPLDSLGSDVDAIVATPRRKVFSQLGGHSPGTTSHIQNTVVGLKIAELLKVRKELFSDSVIVAITRKK